MSKNLKNKTIIRWEVNGYTAVDASWTKDLPENVKKMLIDILLRDLGIEMRTL